MPNALVEIPATYIIMPTGLRLIARARKRLSSCASSFSLNFSMDHTCRSQERNALLGALGGGSKGDHEVQTRGNKRSSE